MGHFINSARDQGKRAVLLDYVKEKNDVCKKHTVNVYEANEVGCSFIYLVIVGGEGKDAEADFGVCECVRT